VDLQDRLPAEELNATRAKPIGLLCIAAISSGCASIVTGHNQSLSVETHSKGAAVVGSACTLQNNKGTWFVTAPGSVIVNRSYGDLTVSCNHESQQPGAVVVSSSTKAMAFGNIIFGGVIGAAVDVGTGAAYDYPSLISVEFGVLPPIPAPARPEPIPAKGEAPIPASDRPRT
jgi:hypothetical protein